MARIIPKFQVQVKKGIVTILNLEKYREYVKSLKDGYYEIVLRRPKKIRSLQQNAYFHGVVVKLMSDETGTDFFEMKDLLKSIFLKKTVVFMGKTYEVVQHSADLDTIDFNNFVKKIQQFGAEFNINIPDPNEVDLQNYQKEEIES